MQQPDESDQTPDAPVYDGHDFSVGAIPFQFELAGATAQYDRYRAWRSDMILAATTGIDRPLALCLVTGI